MLISTIKRLGINYHIIGDGPQDRDTVVVIECRPVPIYMLITQKGITYEHSPLNAEEINFRDGLLVSTCMAAIEVVESDGYIND